MIPLVKPFIPPPEVLMPALQETIYSGYIAEGEKVYQFEDKFSKYIQNPNSISLNSGTAALHISLLLAGVVSGDEVISTALTAEPTNVAIKLVGAKVVWADIDSQTGLLDPISVKAKITNRTKAIIVVHYAGMIADLGAFKKISKEYNIPIIEDAAHALGAKYLGLPIGSHSDYTIFSLQAIKHMTTIDGGILATKSKEKMDEGRLLRWFGLDKTKTRLDNNIKNPGFKYHMNNVNATFGLIQMDYLSEIINKYIDNGLYYDRELNGISGIDLMQYYPGTEASYWLYTLKVENRYDFVKMLAERGVSASELHLRNDRHEIFKESKTHLPNLDEFYKKMVHIPCGWWLTPEDREFIIAEIKKGW